jgi:hypothetical protein
MKVLAKFTIVVALLYAAFSWWNAPDVREWRQKTTLEVETPTGLVTGGSVVKRRVSVFRGLNRMMSASAISTSKQGEAAFVEVAPGKYLFALSVAGSLDRTHEIFRDSEKEDFDAFTKRAANIRETRAIPPALYPQLVTFTDINDPASVKLVDPNNLAATFGPGFALKGMKLEITDEKVTEGKIERVLTWEKSLVGSIGKNMDLPYNHILNQINDGTFSTQVER